MNTFNVIQNNGEFSIRPGHRTGMKNIEKWKRDILRNWVLENKQNPYPSENTKDELAKVCNLSKKQVSNWFTNARKVRQGLILVPIGSYLYAFYKFFSYKHQFNLK
jgi:hypothetical protein